LPAPPPLAPLCCPFPPCMVASSKRKEKKLGECASLPASRSERTPSPESSTAPTIITTRDIGRPVLVKGYGPGLLMYWGLYHKTARPRAGVAFNRPIGLNNGTIEVGGAGLCILYSGVC